MVEFIKAVSDTVLDMINDAYYDKPLIFYRGYTFKLIKAVSNTVLDMLSAAYYDKPLIFIRATFQRRSSSSIFELQFGDFVACITPGQSIFLHLNEF